MCNLFAGARKSDAWAMLICTLSQRLQFQGDNIKRIRVRIVEKHRIDYSFLKSVMYNTHPFFKENVSTLNETCLIGSVSLYQLGLF